jgi:hypothetical protein
MEDLFSQTCTHKILSRTSSALSLFFLIALSGCGPGGALSSPVSISPAVEQEIENEADAEIADELPNQLPDEDLSLEEMKRYLESLRAERVRKKTEEHLRLEKLKKESESTLKTEPSPEPKPEQKLEPEDELEEVTAMDTIAFRPTPIQGYNLAEVAERLGNLTSEDYLKYQIEHISNALTGDRKYAATPACNYFLYTALKEIKDLSFEPKLKKAHLLDDHVFTVNHGWTQMSLDDVKNLLKNQQTIDVVYQRDAPAGSDHGHVGVIIGIDTQGNFVAAEGVFSSNSKKRVTNQIITKTAKSLSSFRIFVRQPDMTLAQINKSE